MSKGWAGGSTRRWRRIRSAVLERNQIENGGRCQIAVPGAWKTRDGKIQRCAVVADCVHHTRGKRFGDDPKHLVAACTPCNLHVGEPTVSDPAPRPRTKWGDTE